MATKVETAVESFTNGCNCAQAVFSTYAPHFGIAEQDAIRLSTGFGGGIARMQEVCGAVTGGVMVIGSAEGMNHPTEKDRKEQTYTDVRDFVARFKDKHRTILCRELLECDINTTEGKKYFDEHNLHSVKCTVFVRDAASLVEECVLHKQKGRKGKNRS